MSSCDSMFIATEWRTYVQRTAVQVSQTTTKPSGQICSHAPLCTGTAQPLIIYEISQSAQQHSDNRWRHTISLPISMFSALGVFHVMRYINVRYLLTYLLAWYKVVSPCFTLKTRNLCTLLQYSLSGLTAIFPGTPGLAGTRMSPFWIHWSPSYCVWLGGRVVRTLDLRSIGCEFESWPLRYRVQPWASC